MKILILSLLLLCCTLASRPAIPYCRSAPIPQIIPLDVNSTVRFDLEEVFDGFNLEYTAPIQDNIDIVPKYTGIKSTWSSSFNFTTAKIKAHNRFLGLIINGYESKLVVGTNDEKSGIKINQVITVEDISNQHCFDVDEIMTRNASFAVIDCATFRQGELVENHFFYVNLETGTRVLGGKTTESFVNYHYMSKRHIEVLEDPMNRVLYILRIIPRDGVDQEHQNNTYVEIFLIRNEIDPQILDVIDYTFIGEKSLSIVDYQISFGNLYLLAYNKGLFEIILTPSQRIFTRNFFEIKMDMYRFKVDRIGFNDDIYLVMTNGNQIYTYEWDNMNPPKLIQKYGLMPGSYVEQLVCDTQFIIITTRAQIDKEIQRKHWIFSKQSSSYTHAFNVFDAPQYGPAIMQWQGNDNVLHLYHEYNAYSFKLSLPYLEVNPANKPGKKDEYTVTAISRGSNGETVNCTEKFTFLYQYPNDTSIIKTGFRDNMKLTVDSPDEEQINLMREFYGRNLSYDIKFQINGSMIVPRTYVDKIHEAAISEIPNLKHENIVFIEMFEEEDPAKSQKPEDIYGLIQVVQEDTKNDTKPIYTTHYVHCAINVLDRDNTHSLRCRIISSTRFGMGRIAISSQMFDIHERRLALVFEDSLNEVYIYYFWSAGFGYYGRKIYAGDAWTRLSGVTINKGKLFCTLEISKTIQVYNLNDLREEGAIPAKAYPIFNLTSNIMRFFGIDYWAPVDAKISPFHDEVLFVKTKIGVMAININEQGIPELLFHLPTDNVKYDFEVNHQNLVIIDEDRCEFYHLYTPLRRTMQPYLKETVSFKFSLNEYTQLTSDRLFYLVGFDEVIIINPLWSNTNQVYQQLYFKDLVLSVDAVNIDGREILFVHTMSKLYAYVIREQPVLYVEWPAHQYNFNISLTAYNNYTKSQPYNFIFNVLETNQTEITPTDKFDSEEVKKLGHVRVREDNGRKFTFNVTFNDTQWFNGNVFRYTINCKQCNKSEGKIKVKNHVDEVQQLVVGKAIYDMDSTFNGIFAQQYNSYLKTWSHNDSIEYIQNIPTIYSEEVCSKIVVDHNSEYVVSLCETGNEVNVYITSLISDKPFTLGPFPTEAKAVNHAKIVDDILMIVDNEDNPFARNGGIYLYALTFGEEVDLAMIDFIDNEDLRDVQGFSGFGFIGSADFHDSHGIQEYRIFITDSFSGNVFVFSFELSADRLQIIYLSKKIIDLKKYIPDHIDAPTRLRLLTVNIHYYFSSDKDNTVQYYLLFTVGNWHHVEFLVVMDRTDNIKQAKLLRMFERIPWTLSNYIKLRRTWERSQFAVSYIDYENDRQIVAVYQADRIITPLNQTQIAQLDKKSQQDQLVEVPLNKILGVHGVRDIFEVAYAFHARGLDTLLFTDMDGYNITELEINPNVTLLVKDITEQDTVNITAHNPYGNYSFTIELKYIDQDEEQREEIMWIVIIALAAIIVVGLIVVYLKQKWSAKANKSKSPIRPIIKDGNQQSLITVEDQYKEEYINRTSVDPNSVRGTIDLGLTDSLLGNQNTQENLETKMIRQENNEQE